jgi:hypothetical protein
MKPAIGIALIVCAVLLFWLADSPDEASPYQETTINRVREAMRDPDAKIENVIVHHLPGEGPHGLSYACGFAIPSRDINAPPKRFIYYFGHDTVSFIEQLRDSDLMANARSLCDAAPLPFDRFDTSDGKMRLKTTR